MKSRPKPFLIGHFEHNFGLVVASLQILGAISSVTRVTPFSWCVCGLVYISFVNKVFMLHIIFEAFRGKQY